MNSRVLTAGIDGIGFWARGLPSWEAARGFIADGTLPAEPPLRPSPQLLAPNERRRAPETVAVALEVALAACADAGREAATLSSVFTSTHGELPITHYMCETLADDPRAISPTRFHNSVHNAAAGYWTIGSGAMTPATAVSAYDASFAQGLLEAMVQLATGEDAVLLVAYDGQATGPLAQTARSTGLLGAALVLGRVAMPGKPHLRVSMSDTPGPLPQPGPLARLLAGNAMVPMLPLFEALARRDPGTGLLAGPQKMLRVEIGYD